MGFTNLVTLHIRYTARQGVASAAGHRVVGRPVPDGQSNGLTLLFRLRYGFPSEWGAFLASAKPFTATIRRDYFSYFTQGKEISITGIDLCDGEDGTPHKIDVPPTACDDLRDPSKQQLVLTADPAAASSVLKRTADASFYLIVRYTLV